MRRIYESEAIHRDDDEPCSPNENGTSEKPQAMRSVNGTWLSRLIVPNWLRHRSISLDISSPKTEYAVGDTVPFAITMKNSMPFPITIPTTSPVLWNWYVDDLPEASEIPLRDPPDERGTLVFDRGERKRVSRRWQQLFRVSETEWESAEPGEYTIAVELNVEDPVENGFASETTVRIVEEETSRE